MNKTTKATRKPAPKKPELYLRLEAPILNELALSVTEKAILLDALEHPEAHTCHDIGARLQMNPQTIQRHVRHMKNSGVLHDYDLGDYKMVMQSPALARTDASPAEPFLNPYEKIILLDIAQNTPSQKSVHAFRLADIAQRQGISISAVVKYVSGLRRRGLLIRDDSEASPRKGVGCAYLLVG